MPIHTYTNWNSRSADLEEQVEPYRKYFFICEGANTETFYFRKLIDLRKQLGIHPLIDIRLWEKTDGDKDISFPQKLRKTKRKILKTNLIRIWIEWSLYLTAIYLKRKSRDMRS